MQTYSAVIVASLAAVVTPAFALAWLLRPKPFKYVLRGGEAAICLACGIFAGRTLLLIASGVPITYPGDGWAVVSITLLGVVGLLLWSRLAQLARHNARNKDAGNRMMADLRHRYGADVEEEIANIQSKRKKTT